MLQKIFKTSILFLFLAGCSGSDDGKIIGAPMPDESTEDSAIYQVTFTSLWNATDHVSVPGNAHFSPIVTSTHTDAYALFPKGDFATSGFESLAETGATGSIETEINAAVTAESVLRGSVESDLFLSGGSTLTFQISVSKTFPLISFVTMIAPSPDWVVGVDALELYSSNGGFVEDSGEIDLFAYNAGTEDGDTAGNYSISNNDTSPKQAISRLTGSGFDEPFAKVQFVRMP